MIYLSYSFNILLILAIGLWMHPAKAFSPAWLFEVLHDYKENSARTDSISLYSDPWLRFKLSKSDTTVYTHNRSELARNKWTFKGSERIYRLTVRVPEEWEWSDTTTSVVQWHPGATPAGELRTPPPLGLAIRGNKWTVINKHDANPETYPPWEEHILLEKDIEKGVPVIWEFHIKWNWGQNGFIKIRVNNQLVYDESGPNSFNFNNGKGGVHMLFGLMKTLPQWAEGETVRQIDIKDITVGWQ